MPTDTILIQPNRATATLLVNAGDGPTLIFNSDLNNTIFLGNNNSIKPGDSNGIVPLGPNGSLAVDGRLPFYGVIQTGIPAVTVYTIAGGLSNFLGLTQGGGNLVIPSIQSPNFIHNVSGWQIQKSGSAEFNNLVIRGTFFGFDFIINSNGIFFYSGVPANGNLFMYWTLAAGTDGFGNAYNQGLYIGNASSSTPQVALIPSSGGPSNPAVLEFPLSPSNFFGNQPNIQALSPGSTGTFIIAGPGLSQVAFTDWVEDFYISFSGTTPAKKVTNYVDINGNHIPYQQISFDGASFGAATVSGIHPGTGTSKSNTAVNEPWQNLPLAAGWTAIAGQSVPGYRVWAQDHVVEITMALQFTGNIPGGQQVNLAALPPGYWPATLQFIPRNPGAAGISITNAGIIQATLDPGQTTQFLNINGKYPLNR